MSMAKLYIRGMKEPLLITIEQAEKVNKVLEDTTIPEESRINVANGKWVGAKRLINYVTFEAVGKSESAEQTFTKETIDRYREDLAIFLKGRPRTKELQMEFFEKKGAIRIEKFMSEVPGIGEIWTPIVKNIGLYKYLREIEDYIEFLDRNANWAEQHNEERLAQLVDKVKDKMTLE